MSAKTLANILAVLIVMSSSLTAFASDGTGPREAAADNTSSDLIWMDISELESIPLPNNLWGKDWRGADISPLAEKDTSTGSIYVYSFYGGHTVTGKEGGRLAKIWYNDPAGPSAIWELQVSDQIGLRLSEPMAWLFDRALYTVGTPAYEASRPETRTIYKITNLDGKPSVEEDYSQADNLMEPLRLLNWPVDSSEITLWYGKGENAVFNQGMSLQGTADSNVYSVCDGRVVYNGYSKVYGNLLYVNFNLEGMNMQVRYGHLAQAPCQKTGETVKEGEIIGAMGRDSETGNGVIAVVLAQSTDGKPCRIDGSNVTFIEPINKLGRPRSKADDNEYLSLPMATILDRTGLSYTALEE